MPASGSTACRVERTLHRVMPPPMIVKNCVAVGDAYIPVENCSLTPRFAGE